MACDVSIIIPVYNRERVLARAIRSVKAQTFNNWELIIVDDCSTDGTFDIANGFRDDSIRVFRAEKNGGAGAARNLGFRMSKGKYIALLDSDDVFHPDFLKESIQIINNLEGNYGFTYTGVGKIADEGTLSEFPRHTWKLPERLMNTRKPYLYQLHIGTSTGIVLRRSVIEKVGFFDESIKAAEDTDFFIRVSEFFRGFGIDKVLIYKDETSHNRLTSSFTKLADAYDTMIAKNFEDIKADPILVKRWYYKSMWLNFYRGNKDNARKSFARLKEENCLSIKTSIVFGAGVVLSKNYFERFHKALNRIF